MGARMEMQAARNDVGGMPVLASELVGVNELDGLVDRVCGGGGAVKRVRGEGVLGMGVRSLDDALEGSLEGGRVVGIQSEAGAGGSEICQALIAEALVGGGEAATAVVDTTGNFDIMKLYTCILGRLQRDPQIASRLHSSEDSSDSDINVEDVAAKVLDRVKIMRVFDFVGVREAVGEIRDELEGKGAVVAEKGKEAQEEVKEEVAVADESPVVEAPRRRTYVADSEDEEDEEMLFDSETNDEEPAPPTREPDSVQQDQTEGTKPDEHHNDNQDTRTKTKLILIDNLTQVLNPLLKNDYIEANALASAFLRQLTSLTLTHTLYTLLLNPTTTPRAPSPSRQPPQQPGQPLPPPPQQHQHQAPPQPPSIFASSTAIPSLMNLLSRHVDVGLLVTRVPRRKIDARVYYSEEGGGGSKGVKKRGVEMVSVLEVMSDRWEGRVGSWGTFVVSDEGIKGVV